MLLKQPQVRGDTVHAHVVHSHAVMLKFFKGSYAKFQQALDDGTVAEHEDSFYFVDPTKGATKMTNVIEVPTKRRIGHNHF